ncbi:hypothetical protein JZ751_003390 [Albula glossodonta]|uniref:Uncharacterized protein n=1 Tax=Albula glossodonta TaxID=121402 RepID=A0A8T2NB40_9TELE|nr:hypothetical protein JZ751_003390 [Albula glossodonta]
MVSTSGKIYHISGDRLIQFTHSICITDLAILHGGEIKGSMGIPEVAIFEGLIWEPAVRNPSRVDYSHQAVGLREQEVLTSELQTPTQAENYGADVCHHLK